MSCSAKVFQDGGLLREILGQAQRIRLVDDHVVAEIRVRVQRPDQRISGLTEPVVHRDDHRGLQFFDDPPDMFRRQREEADI